MATEGSLSRPLHVFADCTSDLFPGGFWRQLVMSFKFIGRVSLITGKKGGF